MLNRKHRFHLFWKKDYIFIGFLTGACDRFNLNLSKGTIPGIFHILALHQNIDFLTFDFVWTQLQQGRAELETDFGIQSSQVQHNK